MQKQYEKTRQCYIHENGVSPSSIFYDDEEIEYQQGLIGRALEASNTNRNPPSRMQPVQESAIKVLIEN